MHEARFGIAGGAPFGCLLGDYEFGKKPSDIKLLRDVAAVSAQAFAPFVAAAGPGMFGWTDFSPLATSMPVAETFTYAEYAAWRDFRDSEDSRFVTLTMPRVLARAPYAADAKAGEYAFHEMVLGCRRQGFAASP